MDDEKKTELKNRRKRFLKWVIIPLLVICGGVMLFFYLQYKRTHVSTGDAYVDGRVHIIASKVSGTVKALHVQDNQFVKKGNLLLEIDPLDYEVKIKEAQAALETEKTRLTEIREKVETTKKQLVEANAALAAARAELELQLANLKQAEIDFQRAEFLVKKELIAKQEFDHAKTAFVVASAQVKAGRDHVKQMEASLDTQRAVIRQTEAGLPPQEALVSQREATLKGAELNLAYAKLFAPADGYITKRTVESGNQIQPSQPLMAVVPLDQENIWITANYKETELRKVKPGQRVEIRVDTYPDKTFYGRVNSIMAGTGSVFSLFPPENATGNFVKVVQRIPVKIVLEKGTDPKHLLRVGMSVVPTILVDP